MMKPFSLLLILGAGFFIDVLAAPSPCPLVGPAFPWPTPSLENKCLDTARRNLSALLFKAANGSTNSIAVQAFDTSNTSPLFQWTYTADNLDTKLGVSHVDQDSVFRVGSVSKLWAMTLFLAEAGIDTFSDPVAKYIPEIQSAVSGDAIDSVQWANVTIGDLASHLAGVGRDCMSAFPLPRREILRKIPLLTILLFRWHP
jgi:CubicO group peptidase (beta-lactamase class C family)